MKNILTHNCNIVFKISIVICLLYSFVGCKKSNSIANQSSSNNVVDTVIIINPPPPPPPPVLSDSISYIKRLEEDYILDNPTIVQRKKNYSFYYDTEKRVTKIGVKVFGVPTYDSATCKFFYSGTSTKPFMSIIPDFFNSFQGNPICYDTTYFRYNSNNQILADSSYRTVDFDSTFTYHIKVPLKRYYTYPTSTRTIIAWYSANTPGSNLFVIRTDTIDNVTTGQLNKTKNVILGFYNGNGYSNNYAVSEAYTYSTIYNPLSKLNISGTIFSLIYSPVIKEILGNSNHTAINSSHVFPFYMDFYSSRIPVRFYLGGFTPFNQLLGQGFEMFDIQTTPWSVRPNYPSKTSVRTSSGLQHQSVLRYYY